MTKKEKPRTQREAAHVQLNVRIPRALAHRLQRAALWQRQSGRSPQTQADIVAAAVEAWLTAREPLLK